MINIGLMNTTRLRGPVLKGLRDNPYLVGRAWQKPIPGPTENFILSPDAVLNQAERLPTTTVSCRPPPPAEPF